MRQQIVPLNPELIDRARQINGIPKDDGGDHQVEAGGAVSLFGDSGGSGGWCGVFHRKIIPSNDLWRILTILSYRCKSLIPSDLR